MITLTVKKSRVLFSLKNKLLGKRGFHIDPTHLNGFLSVLTHLTLS